MDSFLGMPLLPLDAWIQDGVNVFVQHYRGLFQLLRLPVEQFLEWINQSLRAVPPALMIAVLGILGYVRRGTAFAAFCVVSAVLMGWLGFWAESMTSIGIVATSVAFAALLGVPIGILLAEHDGLWRLARPLLDVMQTTPSFVYLVPVVMLFGIGSVPGVIATIVFAIPPLVKLTYLGIKQVSPESIEAGEAFGASRAQLLFQVKLPLALDAIRAGINQTIMLAMVMSSVAAMIGAEGLGLVVLRGISRLDVGMAATGGLCLVLLALMLDGLTQGAEGERPARIFPSFPFRLRRTKTATA
ncbi:hypothetical protein GCM10023144_17740 [Pigmentiphaga soli]|uniref:ABC transmembrane type-1 domain-containing protein n=1 Tax=Pigmentiphaga soli TaxID=1007095 RepID=A0ABP8GUU4_9BURK